MQHFSRKKINFKMLSSKWQPFCLGLNELMDVSARCYKNVPRGLLRSGQARVNHSTLELGVYFLKLEIFRWLQGTMHSNRPCARLRYLHCWLMHRRYHSLVQSHWYETHFSGWQVVRALFVLKTNVYLYVDLKTWWCIQSVICNTLVRFSRSYFLLCLLLI